MEWGLSGWPKDKRPFSSVILDKGIAENIKNDITEFLQSSKWYRERGIYFFRCFTYPYLWRYMLKRFVSIKS